ncbi:unnamed protein product [Victoria cruziana]
MAMIVRKAMDGEDYSEDAQHLDDTYFDSPSCINPGGSSTVMSKKVKARKLVMFVGGGDLSESKPRKTMPILVYCRRRKRPRSSDDGRPSFFDSLMDRIGREDHEVEEWGYDSVARKKRRELRNLSVTSGLGWGFRGDYAKESRVRKAVDPRHGLNKSSRLERGDELDGGGKGLKVASSERRWVRVNMKCVEPNAVIGRKCKVYWPLDYDWYTGSVCQFVPDRKQHHVKYDDGDDEWINLENEQIKFYLSREELTQIKLKSCTPEKAPNYDELMMLAASSDDCGDFVYGEIVWAKITGHAMWPAIVMDETQAARCKGLERAPREISLPVQFFGTYDYARIKMKQIIPFYKGLLSSFHLKCKHARFLEGLEETRRYLKERELPERIACLQASVDNGLAIVSEEKDESNSSVLLSDEKDESAEYPNVCPFEIGDLKVTNLGKIVKDSEYFHSEHYIWPVGYCAIRKFASIADSKKISEYKMEVLRNPRSKALPLFRVTLGSGEQINGRSPSACWRKVYGRIKKASVSPVIYDLNVGKRNKWKSGSYMFGFSIKKVRKLIQGLPNSSSLTKYVSCKLAGENHSGFPTGYRPVNVDLKDLEKCNVCHMDEEYEDNLFLQCDKCLMVVHARCYGELEPLSEKLWLCNLCRPGAPVPSPCCCLCPVVGGAMKKTTDGRWAHLACAMWIPETFLVDIHKMEPIDGLSKISKDRWKLLCSICCVPYGACIQCSHKTCRVAYHPLCARAAGLCVELEDEENMHKLISVYEDDNQCVRLVSFCNKHRKPSNKSYPVENQTDGALQGCSDYQITTSGCARSEPYNFFGRRGHKEPEALASASLKRLFVENRPYLVGGCRRNCLIGDAPLCRSHVCTGCSSNFHQCGDLQVETSKQFLSLTEKYKYMQATYRKRLAFGKSRIHGFGVFAKRPHKAGEMVIEYIGELVRPKIADRREHLFYNSLVGAGTYMFKIDNERVIDATRAGNIAHLINHSCEPNCYSRVVTVCGDEHIIIFTKREISLWEELTYDYRFFSINERLTCYCGFPKCRGVVNDVDST